MRNYQATALQKEEELTNLKGQCDDLLNQNEDLKNRHYECQEALEHIQKHLAYRAYRKIKDLMRHRG
jgi:FtsZ-binding cell division protein ZapB